MTSRREILRKLIKGTAVVGSGGLLWGTAVAESKSNDITLRPPGAQDDKGFGQACIRCGKCVEACPYDTLLLSSLGDNHTLGTPYFEPRDIPCYMCTDYPCTIACPSGALDIDLLTLNDEPPTINNAKMGLAVIHEESCIAFWGIQCDACYRACPLMDEAIVLEYEKNTATGKHANLKPVVKSDVCTGCGVCEHACVVEKAAIHVLPLEIATGEVGDHYIKSWDKEDEKRIRDSDPENNSDEKDIESALDYLNDDTEL